MDGTLGALIGVFFLPFVAAEFQLYRFYDRPTIVEAWNITDACITALNTTVACDEAVSSLAGQGVDYNYWYIENLTTLCDPVCQDSMKSWGSLVETACGAETIYQSGVEVQAKALSLSFTYNSDIACVRDSDNRWCFLESQEWQGSDYIRWDPGMCFAYEEVPAQCSDPGFDLDEINSDMSGLTNLYDSSLYCSECFLELFRMRMLDPWLTNSNFTQYMLDEFSAIQSACSTTLPYTTSSATLYIGTPTTSSSTTAVSTTSGAVTATPTCLGQLIRPQSNYLTCNDLCDDYQVSTGDARVATRDYSCQFNTTICLPLPCELDTVWDSPSCATLAERYSNSTNRLTELQFLAWNPNIQGSCDGIAIGQRVCKGAPGGTFPSPVATITAPAATGTGVYYSTATPAHPTQSGSIPDCGRYYLVASGDDCYTVDIQFSITFDQLREYNTYLDEQCSNLWLDYDVCVARVTQPKTSTDGTCGVGVTCVGSGFGDCCSPYGNCGNGPEYCGTGGNGTATTDGTCGPDHGGTTCTNPLFGDCCSIYGFCGTGSDFCGAGNCYSGNCETDNGGPSVNGECGPNFAGNKTCTGTQFGNCCSTSGFCGSTADYCSGSNCYSGLCTP